MTPNFATPKACGRGIGRALKSNGLGLTPKPRRLSGRRFCSSLERRASHTMIAYTVAD